MNSVFLKYICFLILLFCIGCNPATYEHYQKKEIEDIGISFPASAKCFFFTDCSGERVTIYKEWVLCADTPFVFKEELNWRDDSPNPLTADIINHCVGRKIIQFSHIKKEEFTRIDRDDGIEVRIKRIKHENQYFLHFIFIKL